MPVMPSAAVAFAALRVKPIRPDLPVTTPMRRSDPRSAEMPLKELVGSSGQAAGDHHARQMRAVEDARVGG